MIPRFRNGKSIRLCRRQLRLISVLFKFERQFLGQLRIAGTNYEPSEAALIRVQGTDQRTPLPCVLCHPHVWVTPCKVVSGFFFGEGSARVYFPMVLSVCVCVRICQVLLPHSPEPVCVCVCLKDLLCSTPPCS